MENKKLQEKLKKKDEVLLTQIDQSKGEKVALKEDKIKELLEREENAKKNVEIKLVKQEEERNHFFS